MLKQLKRFADLLAKMSPDAAARADARAKQRLRLIDKTERRREDRVVSGRERLTI